MIKNRSDIDLPIPDTVEAMQKRLQNAYEGWVRCGKAAKTELDNDRRKMYLSDVENWDLQGRLLVSMIHIKRNLKKGPPIPQDLFETED